MARCKLRGLEEKAIEAIGIKEEERRKRDAFELHKKTPLIWVKTGTPDPKHEASRRHKQKLREKYPIKSRRLPGPRYQSGGLKKPTGKQNRHENRKEITDNAIRKGFLNRGNPDPSPAA